MPRRPNPFIVVEALDAGGSQTQTDQLSRRLKREGYNVLQLHFPQEDQATGQLIYEKYLHDHNKHPFSKREQALLYIQDFFSRAEDIQNHLSRSKKSLVVSDRFYTSTLAYQSVGLSGKKRRDMLDWMRWLCCENQPSLPTPDRVILLDTPVEISLKHLREKRKDLHENRQKLTVFRRSYLRLAKEENWTVINSVNERGRLAGQASSKAGEQRSIEDIHQEIWQIVEPILATK